MEGWRDEMRLEKGVAKGSERGKAGSTASRMERQVKGSRRGDPGFETIV